MVVRGHSEGIFRVSEVCGTVCNMKPVMFVSPSMEVIKHSCIQGDVNFIGVIGRMFSGSSVKCSHMKQIVLLSFLDETYYGCSFSKNPSIV